MQFNFYLNQSHNVATFTNFNISKVAAKKKLFELFRRVGGDNPQYELEWIFPKTVYRYHIEEIIHNTCFVCRGLMKDSEYHSDHILRKCQSCGHSHT